MIWLIVSFFRRLGIRNRKTLIVLIASTFMVGLFFAFQSHSLLGNARLEERIEKEVKITPKLAVSQKPLAQITTSVVQSPQRPTKGTRTFTWYRRGALKTSNKIVVSFRSIVQKLKLITSTVRVRSTKNTRKEHSKSYIISWTKSIVVVHQKTSNELLQRPTVIDRINSIGRQTEGGSTHKIVDVAVVGGMSEGVTWPEISEQHASHIEKARNDNRNINDKTKQFANNTVVVSKMVKTNTSVNLTEILTAQTPPKEHGIKPEDRLLYLAGREKGTFVCLDKSQRIPFKALNDNYCDCRDGSDEPGTSACTHGRFYCLGEKKFIRSSKVNDGLCDCCDGSDEWDHTNFVGFNQPEKPVIPFIPCKVIC